MTPDMTPERLAHIREMAESSRTYTITKDGVLAVVARHRRELLAYVDDLTRQLDDARRLALPAFTSPEGDLSEHTHVLDLVPDVNWPAPKVQGDRPSAYDMPVGSVVVTEAGIHTRTGSDHWRLTGDYGHRLRSDFIESLFTDGLVTEWRLP